MMHSFGRILVVINEVTFRQLYQRVFVVGYRHKFFLKWQDNRYIADFIDEICCIKDNGWYMHLLETKEGICRQCFTKLKNVLCDDSIRQTYLYVAQLWKNIGGHQWSHISLEKKNVFFFFFVMPLDGCTSDVDSGDITLT
jgi:hypothetical protein